MTARAMRARISLWSKAGPELMIQMVVGGSGKTHT